MSSARTEVPEKAFVLLGRATRLPDKFLLPVDGEAVVLRAVRTLRRVGLDVSAVSVRPVDLAGVRVLRDRRDVGPLGAVAEIVARTREPFFLFGGDMPYLDGPTIARMREAFDGRALVPVDAVGRWQVLHAVYPELAPADVEPLVLEGAGLRDLLGQLQRGGRVRLLPPGTVPPRSFVDIDTFAEYARLGGRAARPSRPTGEGPGVSPRTRKSRGGRR